MRKVYQKMRKKILHKIAQKAGLKFFDLVSKISGQPNSSHSIRLSFLQFLVELNKDFKPGQKLTSASVDRM